MVYINIDKIRPQVTLNKAYDYMDSTLANRLNDTLCEELINDIFNEWEAGSVGSLDSVVDAVYLPEKIDEIIDENLEDLEIDDWVFEGSTNLRETNEKARWWAKDNIVGAFVQLIRDAIESEYGEDPMSYPNNLEGFESN